MSLITRSPPPPLQARDGVQLHVIGQSLDGRDLELLQVRGARVWCALMYACTCVPVRACVPKLVCTKGQAAGAIGAGGGGEGRAEEGKQDGGCDTPYPSLPAGGCGMVLL